MGLTRPATMSLALGTVAGHGSWARQPEVSTMERHLDDGASSRVSAASINISAQEFFRGDLYMFQPIAFPIGAVALALVLAACGGESSSGEPGDDQAPDRDPQLLTWRNTDAAHPDAAIVGTLRVNSTGCFTLGRNVLVAPEGSRVVDNGNAIHIPKLGTRKVGDTVKGVGGYHSPDDPGLTEQQLRCLPEDSKAEFGYFGVDD